MEKIAIQLWKKNDIDEDEFKSFLVKKVPSSLADIVSNYQVNIVDKDVQAASGLIQSSYPPSPDAIVFLTIALSDESRFSEALIELQELQELEITSQLPKRS